MGISNFSDVKYFGTIIMYSENDFYLGIIGDKLKLLQGNKQIIHTYVEWKTYIAQSSSDQL